MIRVTKREIGNTAELLNRLENIGSIDVTSLGDIARKKMITIIDDNRKRLVKVGSERYKGKYKAHLKNSIIANTTDKGFELAINTEKTPYWKIIDAGGRPPGPVRGQFSDDGANTGRGSFAYNPNMPKMVPKKPIIGMHYISKTNDWIKQNIQKYIDKALQEHLFGNKFKNRLKTFRVKNV